MSPKMLVSTTTSLFIGLIFLAAYIYFAKKFKEDNGGFISFGQLFAPLFVLQVIGGIITTIFFAVLVNVIDSSIQDVMKESAIDTAQWMLDLMGQGDNQEMVDKAVEEAENEDYSMGALKIVGTIFGVAVFS